MIKDGITQEITVNRSVYNCSEVLSSCITNEIAVRCYRDFNSFCVWNACGQLQNISIDDLVSTLRNTFLVKEYGIIISDCVSEDAHMSSVRLTNDHIFIFLDTNSRTSVTVDGDYSEDEVKYGDGDARNTKDAINLWSVQFGGNIDTCRAIAALLKQYIVKINRERKGIFCITEGRGRLDLTHIGYPGKEIIKTNYSELVMKGFDRIVKDICSKKPSGFLTIISGPPGTGKTYMVRGIIDATEKDALFITIPPSTVASMSGPHIVPLLAEIREYYLRDKTCVVFVIEDADDILVPRGADNMSSISTLLNCTDGITGSMFDMRFIATTNADSLTFDNALIRPGRLSCKLDIDVLNRREAIIAYNIITNSNDGKNVIMKDMTLAEVYAKANGNDFEIDDSKKKVGF